MPTQLTPLKALLNAYVRSCKTDAARLIPSVFLEDLVLLESYVTKVIELKDKYEDSDDYPTNDDLETLNLSIVIIMECIKKINDRVEPRWNLSNWTPIVLNWIQVRASIVNDIILGTLSIMTNIETWQLDTKLRSLDPLGNVEKYFKVYGYADLAGVRGGIDLYADKFARLKGYMLSSLYTGTDMDTDTSKYESYTDQEEILNNAQSSARVADEAGNSKSSTLSAMVYTTLDRAKEAVAVAKQVHDHLDDCTADSVEIEAKYLQYMGSDILRYTDDTHSNLSQSIMIIEDVMKFRDEWLEKIRWWSIGMFRTVAELVQHLAH